MQKKQKIILGILTLFVVAAAVFFLTYKKETVETPAPTATSTATTTVTNFEVKTESLVDTEDSYDVLVEYPQFVGAKTGSVEDRMNIQFKKDAKGVFEQTSAELKLAATDMVGREIIFERKLQGDKTYINNETGIMSFVYAQYIDTGGAHGTFFYVSESLDIKSGEKLVLTDVLKGSYDGFVTTEIDTQIRNAATTCVRCDRLKDELTNLKVEIPDNFLLSDQGITFLFGAYELGSYAATASGQEVFIHKDQLGEYILRTW